MIKRLEHVLLVSNQLILGLMMALMFLLVFSNVVTRYAFGFTLNWTEEVSRYLMIWVAYLGVGLAMRGRNHVAIEMLQDRLPQKLRRLLRGVVGLILISFMVTLAFLGFRYSQFAMSQETAVLQLPMGLVYLAVPIGAIVFLLYMVTMFREYIEQLPVDHGHVGETVAEGEGA